MCAGLADTLELQNSEDEDREEEEGGTEGKKAWLTSHKLTGQQQLPSPLGGDSSDGEEDEPGEPKRAAPVPIAGGPVHSKQQGALQYDPDEEEFKQQVKRADKAAASASGPGLISLSDARALAEAVGDWDGRTDVDEVPLPEVLACKHQQGIRTPLSQGTGPNDASSQRDSNGAGLAHDPASSQMQLLQQQGQGRKADLRTLRGRLGASSALCWAALLSGAYDVLVVTPAELLQGLVHAAIQVGFIQYDLYCRYRQSGAGLVKGEGCHMILLAQTWCK